MKKKEKYAVRQYLQQQKPLTKSLSKVAVHF